MAGASDNTLSYLYGLQSHGIKPGLSRTITLLGAFEDPHHTFRSFHIAGTNGKGSTAAMLASILTRQGYRVGLYTSPHLIDFAERITVNGVPIPPECLQTLSQAVRHSAEARLTEPPTFFEATTAMAFRHFADAGVQYAVVEVGLGGRFDATNVLTPLVTVITTIALDHQQYLGDSPNAIAHEKAGIIKQDTPIVAGRLDADPAAVINATAQERRAPCVTLGRDFDVRGESPERFAYRGVSHDYDDLICPLPGVHQLDNAACALAATEMALERGVAIGEGSIREGLRTVRWPGRLELAARSPDLLLDGAHNPQAMEALARYLTAWGQRRPPAHRGRLIIVLGMMRDKDRRTFLVRLSAVPGISHLILTRAEHPRAADPEDLLRDAADLDVTLHTRPSVSEALAHAKALAAPNDTICVTGSLLVVGEVKAILEHTTVSPLRG